MVYSDRDPWLRRSTLRLIYEHSMPPKLPTHRRELSQPPVSRELSQRPVSRFHSLRHIFGRAKQKPPTTCTLLARLPLELRIMIYTEVLGKSFLHIRTSERQVSHVKCLSMYDNIGCPQSPRQLAQFFFMAHEQAVNMDIPTSSANLALLQTCRQIYTEAINILYSANTFDFAHPGIFTLFIPTIRPQRLAAITSIHIGWSSEEGGDPFRVPLNMKTQRRASSYMFETDPVDLAKHWDPIWDVIPSQMPGLKRLVVTMVGPRLDNWELQDMLLLPLERLGPLREFTLVVRKVKSGMPGPTGQGERVGLSPMAKRIVEAVLGGTAGGQS
ncbi:hypothetical protein K432DRAFT_384840 [Lepidopterella palustris CBS 459.81]|uniref:DUF7730 domain-containing protein n=1 Tax=Lepidopterella palustris CBS 459.81 TaxID=1314670 RepID=A0A8E2JCD4_9PEZI|nr:hypothetical protein K432DRAFT_384840 [Lepidopterella palustris CBS 459.81]